MRGRRIVLFFCVVFLSACASSERPNFEVRVVNDPVALGCTKVGIIPFGNTSAGPTNFSGGVSPQLQAQVTNLGGNAIGEAVGVRHSYTEVWSCPQETVVLPK